MKYYIYQGDNISELKFRTEISKIIIEKFGNGPFQEEKIVREILIFNLDYYINKFKEVCINEKSVLFYQNIFALHEQATELVHLYPKEGIPKEIKNYIGKYRRVLKFIIEMGCDISMISGEKPDTAFQKRMESTLDDLIFLGEMILTCVSLYAEQSMIEDVTEASLNEKGHIIFSRKHHYEFIFEYIIKELGHQLSKSVVDKNSFDHFKAALHNCFGIKYEDVSHIIASIHQQLESKGGQLVGVGWETLTKNLHGMFGVPLAESEQFFQGLKLDKTNKMDLLSLACKPYNLNRYLYRPILIWNIDGKDFALIGKNAWTETIIQYTTNAIPWGKAPQEWMANKCFKDYVHRKEDEHDKWLDDEVEKKINNQKKYYDRNIKHLQNEKEVVNIDIPGLGEVDFIIISEETKKVFITDCKHLLGRYDIVNQKNDYNAFSVGSKKNKSYNDTMAAKLTWFNNNKKIVQEHFQIKYGDKNILIEDYTFEGIFIVNTPTFCMYNADYRIYTIDQIEDVLKGQFNDIVFVTVGEEQVSNVEYPYFKIPQYVTFDPFKEND